MRRRATSSLLALAVALPLAAQVHEPAAAAAAGNPLSGTSVFALADFAGRIWAGTDSGLYTLAAGSSTWQPVGGPFDGREVNALAVAGSWLVAGTDSGAVRSNDGGTWVGAGLTGERVVSLAAAGGALLAGTGHDTPSDGVVQRSDDQGATWTSQPLSPTVVGLSGDTVQAVLAPSGSSPAWAGTAGSGPYHSGDGKGSWTAASGMQSNWVTSFWRDPSAAGRLLAGSDDGLYSWNGSSWTAVSFPQPDPWIQALATGPDGRVVAGTYDGAVYAQTAAGGWAQRASGLQSVLSLMAVSGGGLLVGTTDGVSCAGCTGTVAKAVPSPGAGGRAAPTLPPPAARGAGTRPRATGAAGAAQPGASASADGSALLGSGTSPGAGSGSPPGGVSPRWWIAGGLVALSVLLFAIGEVYRRRRAGATED